MPITAYGDIGNRTAAYAAAEMLAHAEPILVLSKFGQAKPLPKHKTDTMKFRRPVPFTINATTPLTEGVTPSSQQMQYVDVPVTIRQWGAWVEITDKISDVSEDPVLKDAAMLCGEQAAETVELITWGIIKAGTNVFYGNGASRAVVNSKITLAMQRKITRSLKAARGRKVTSMVGASIKIATEPVAPAFIAFGHTDNEADIRDMVGFTPTEKYGTMQPLPHEIGKVEDVRYVLSPVLAPFLAAGSTTLNGMKSTAGVNVDVYPIIYICKEAYGLTPLKGQDSIEPKVLNTNTPRGADPLGQRGSVGWKTWFEAVILNQTWMARLEVGVSAL